MRKEIRGVTSVEIMATVALFALVSAVVIAIFIVTQTIWAESLSNVMVQNDAKLPMQAIVKELKEADPSSPVGITISPDQRTITFAIPASTSATAITSWTQISFSFNSSTREVTRTAGTSSIVGRRISALSFSQLGNVVTAVLTAAGTAANGRTLSTTITSQIAMRN